jgi:amino acid permease
VHNALAKKSPRTTSLAIGAALVFTSAAYLVMGLSAYFSFGSNTMPNVLGNYGNSIAVDLSRLAIIASVTMLFPLTGVCHVLVCFLTSCMMMDGRLFTFLSGHALSLFSQPSLSSFLFLCTTITSHHHHHHHPSCITQCTRHA